MRFATKDTSKIFDSYVNSFLAEQETPAGEIRRLQNSLRQMGNAGSEKLVKQINDRIQELESQAAEDRKAPRDIAGPSTAPDKVARAPIDASMTSVEVPSNKRRLGGDPTVTIPRKFETGEPPSLPQTRTPEMKSFSSAEDQAISSSPVTPSPSDFAKELPPSTSSGPKQPRKTYTASAVSPVEPPVGSNPEEPSLHNPGQLANLSPPVVTGGVHEPRKIDPESGPKIEIPGTDSSFAKQAPPRVIQSKPEAAPDPASDDFESDTNRPLATLANAPLTTTKDSLGKPEMKPPVVSSPAELGFKPKLSINDLGDGLEARPQDQWNTPAELGYDYKTKKDPKDPRRDPEHDLPDSMDVERGFDGKPQLVDTQTTDRKGRMARYVPPGSPAGVEPSGSQPSTAAVPDNPGPQPPGTTWDGNQNKFVPVSGPAPAIPVNKDMGRWNQDWAKQARGMTRARPGELNQIERKVRAGGNLSKREQRIADTFQKKWDQNQNMKRERIHATTPKDKGGLGQSSFGYHAGKLAQAPKELAKVIPRAVRGLKSKGPKGTPGAAGTPAVAGAPAAKVPGQHGMKNTGMPASVTKNPPMKTKTGSKTGGWLARMLPGGKTGYSNANVKSPPRRSIKRAQREDYSAFDDVLNKYGVEDLVNEKR